jgi:hypothetical protein
MSCSSNLDCLADETCIGIVNSMCVDESTVMWVEFAEGLVFNLIAGVICAILSWYRNPISVCGSDSRLVRTLVAFLLPGVYLLILACQQPTGCCVPDRVGYKPRGNNLGCKGCAGACCNTLAVFFFWPILLCLVPSTNDLVTNMLYIEVV